jgi:hypothetical protein
MVEDLISGVGSISLIIKELLVSDTLQFSFASSKVVETLIKLSHCRGGS